MIGKGNRNQEILKWSTVCKDKKGPELLRSEIMAAITEMKGIKAVGVDNIPTEFWKVLGEEGM